MTEGFNFEISANLWLTVSDIWPDGDAPANPTAKDVEQVIKACGGLRNVISEWNLDDELELTVGCKGDYVVIDR